MRTVTFRNPVKWIWVDIKGVPKPRQAKIKEAFATLNGRGDSGLLDDRQTMYVVVQATMNTEEDVRAHFQNVLDELRLPKATIKITDAWAQAIELYPFVPQASRRALEEQLKAFHVGEVGLAACCERCHPLDADEAQAAPDSRHHGCIL